ncbi:MAG TPA: hypothetical protein VL793_09455 [Patescibacteria group bacterium]|nr:hypothetical protein [Patescibacteria group bacterium]
MKTLEVNQKAWSQFCQRFEEYCRGAMVTIRLECGGQPQETIGEDLPLRHLGLDKQTDPCNTKLVIEAGAADQKPLRHTVVEPVHIRLRNGSGTDRYNRVQILAENGTTTMELRPGLSQELVKEFETQ